MLFAQTEELSLGWHILGLMSIPALVALNGFFVSAEFALVAVRKTRVEGLVARGVKGARAVQKAIEHLDNSIAATQLGITLASIGLGVVSEVALARVFEGVFSWLPEPWNFLARHSVASFLAFFIITFLHVVFGELVPKTLALQMPDTIALWVAGPLSYFAILSRPLIQLMNGAGNALVRKLGFHTAPGSSLVHSVEELALLIEDTEEAGLLNPDQAQLVQNVFLFTDKKVRNCLVPTEKMATLELTTPPEKVLEAVRAGGHTRMPVYQGQIDNIVGIVNTKDLFFLFSLQGVVVLEDALYPPIYLRPDEDLSNAMRLFKKVRRHMALVRDEDGKIHGLITLEDILEEIIGDIEDEHDHPQARRTFLKKITRRRRPALPPQD